MADKYDPIRLVGKGSFGSVYLVSRRRDGAQFVLKNMQIKNVPEKEIEAYENEVRLLTELEHPGVVGHIESFIDGDKHHMCIVMGYCEGGDLGAYIKHKKGIPMRETEVLYHFVQMALALLYMHEKMILHRDLKTQNIFIKNGLIQLGDFGISKALTGSNDFAQTCIGTPYYMSPELFQNKPYNNKSDVWALGCVLYELMTYKHAFDAQSIASLAGKVLKGVFTALPATYPKAMRTLVKDMLQLDPKARPSMHQILTLPFLRKHIKTYVNAVMNAQHMYRPRDLENFKAQLRRLHMEDMLEPAPVNPVPPLALGNAAAAAPANGIVATARASSRAAAAPAAAAPQPSSSASAAAAAAAQLSAAKDREKAAANALRHKEQAARLQELQEEEAQRRSLEEKLSKLKKAHEAKQKLVSEQQKKTAAAAAVRPASALPSARGGSSSSSAAAAAAAGKSSAKSMTPSGSKAVLGAGAAAAGAAPGKKPAAPAGAPPASAGAKRPPSAGPSAVAANGAPSYRAPSSSPPNADDRAIRPAASAAAAAAAAAADHRSSRSALQEERNRKLQQERAEHEQALRLKEIDEMRAAEKARAAEADRLDARRKQLELAKRKKAEVEAEKVAAREKDLERARAEELARQKKVYLAQVEAEKAELERIQLEKQWISKRLDDLAQKPVPGAGAAAAAAGKRSAVAAPPSTTSHARNLREDTDGLSQKDRILAEKAARRAAEEAETQARLLQGRRDAHQDRLKVHNRGAGAVAPHMQSNLTGVAAAIATSPPRAGPSLHRHDSQDYEADGFDDDGTTATARSHARRGRDDTSSEDSDADDDDRSRAEGEVSDSGEIDSEEAQEDLAQEAEAIEEAEGLLLGLTKRIQDLRTSIEVPTVFSDAQSDHEGWDQEVEEEDELALDESEVETADETEAAANYAAPSRAAAQVTTTHAAAASSSSAVARPSSSSVDAAAAALPSIPESVLVRMKSLAKECAQLVGRKQFVAAFELLKGALDARPPWSRERKFAELAKIIGEDKARHWEKVDELVFMERSSTK